MKVPATAPDAAIEACIDDDDNLTEQFWIGAATIGMDGSIGHQGIRATGWALMNSMMANVGSNLPGLHATEGMESF